MRMSISTTSGSQPPRLLDRLGAVGRLADHVDVLLGVEDHPEAGAHQRLVVGDQDADHSAQLSRTHLRTRRRAPRGPRASSPP